MPASAAHWQFGQLVKEGLSKDMNQVVDKYSNEFILGLQGPDFMFYSFPIVGFNLIKLGQAIHRRDARALFERAIGKTKGDDVIFAYLCGLACHFGLDHACHPYVEKVARAITSHQKLEAAFDGAIITRFGISPLRHHYVPVKDVDYEAIACVYRKCTSGQIKSAVRNMRTATHLLENRKLTQGLGNLLHLNSIVSGLSLPEQNKPNEQVNLLFSLFKAAVPQTILLIEKMYQASQSGNRHIDAPFGSFDAGVR